MQTQTWTILDENSLPLLTFTSFISMDISATSKISTYTLEEGSFASYNKTDSPAVINVVLALTGTDGEIQAGIAILESLKKSTQIVSIVSPYQEYKNYNLEKFDYSHTLEAGVGILIADMSFIEIREVEPLYTSSIRYPKNPAAKSPDNLGKQQPASLSSITADLRKKIEEANL